MSKFNLAELVKARSHYTVECFDRRGRLRWRDGFQNLVVTAGLNALLGNTFDAAAGSVSWYVGLIGASTGTVSINSSAASVTGSGTSFSAELDDSPIADIIIVGAGAAGVDLKTTVTTRSSATALTLTANASTTVTGAAFATEPVPGDTMSSKQFNEDTNYGNANRPAWTKNGSPAAGAMSNSSSKASFSVNATARIFGAFLTSSNTVGGTTGTLYGGGLFTVSRQLFSGDTLNVQVDLSVAGS